MSHIYFCTFATRVNCVPITPSAADERHAEHTCFLRIENTEEGWPVPNHLPAIFAAM